VANDLSKAKSDLKTAQYCNGGWLNDATKAQDQLTESQAEVSALEAKLQAKAKSPWREVPSLVRCGESQGRDNAGLRRPALSPSPVRRPETRGGYVPLALRQRNYL
jgi:hypothetical protein